MKYYFSTGILFIAFIFFPIKTQAQNIINADSLHIQGVSFLYGSIVNPQGPVTFGDDVRIDGAIYRNYGPVLIGDDLRVDGALSRPWGPVKIQDGILQLGGDDVNLSGHVYAENGLSVAGNVNLPDGSITDAMLADDVEGNGNLAENSVSTSHIIDGTIINADISNSAAIDASKLSGVINNSPATSQTITYGSANVQTILQMAVSPTTDPFAINNSAGTGIFVIDTNGLVTTPSINSSSIVDGSITADDIADGVISSTGVEDNSVTSAKILDGTIVNADISGSAAIATSKISGLGDLATLSTVGTAQITDETITNSDISGGASISLSKLASSGSINQIITTVGLTGVPTYTTLSGDASLMNGNLSINNVTRTVQLPPLDWRVDADPPTVITGATVPSITSIDTGAFDAILWVSGQTTQKITTTIVIPQDRAVAPQLKITYLYGTAMGTSDVLSLSLYAASNNDDTPTSLQVAGTATLTEDTNTYQTATITLPESVTVSSGDVVRLILGFTAINDSIEIIGTRLDYESTQ